MKSKNWFKNKLNKFQDSFNFQLETLILDVTEKICESMERKKINKTDLAEKLNVSKPAVTKILNGSSNFTLKTLLSLANALDCKLKISFIPKKEDFFVPLEISQANKAKAIAYSDSDNE